MLATIYVTCVFKGGTMAKFKTPDYVNVDELAATTRKYIADLWGISEDQLKQLQNEFWKRQERLDELRKLVDEEGSLENQLVFRYYIDDPEKLRTVDLTPSGVDRASLQYDPVLDEEFDQVTLSNFQKQAMLTAKQTGNYNSELSDAALSVAYQSGEIVSLIKKHLYDNQALDRDTLAEKLGDLLFYTAWIANIIKFDLGTIAKINRRILKETS